MSSLTSSSDSAGFDRLQPALQRWIHERGWTSFHDAQEQAIGPILGGTTDVVISAATAAGKTEAAFLPICSALAAAREATPEVDRDPWTAHDPWADEPKPSPTGIQVLYLSPLKALINDQYDRLDQICERVHIPVHRWHGDVSADAKRKARENPSGVLLITPESLEASFVNRGSTISTFLGGVRYIVIDELHSFLATARGAQLQSLMNRVDLAVRRRPPRIGLSATIGDLHAAATFVRPTKPDAVHIIDASDDPLQLRMQVRGYRITPPRMTDKEAATIERAGGSVTVDDVSGGDQLEIADHLFKTLRGTDNLVFANRRGDIETYADLLARRSERENLPNEFWPHHGSLSKDLREIVEAQLKDRSKPVTAICTSTLEMGIDIGTVASVAQVGAPPSVASLRQRLGRSGRREGPAVLRVYVSEADVDGRSSPLDELRTDLVQTIAMVSLLLDHWIEVPDDPGLNLSTLIQQTLSTIAQHGGANPQQLHSALCGPGPFELVDPSRFARLLRAMSAADLVMQAADRTLLLGVAGERWVNHYSFYTAFQTPEEWTLVADGRRLGTLPIVHPLIVGGLLIFAGRRWQITAIDTDGKVVDLTRSSGGAPPRFGGDAALIGDRIRQEMVAVYTGTDEPGWLNKDGLALLAEGRAAWVRYSLDETSIVPAGKGCLVLPWRGDRALQTAAFHLVSAGVVANRLKCALEVHDCTPDRLATVVVELTAGGPVNALELARTLAKPMVDKWDWVLDDELAAEAAAARELDTEGAFDVLLAAAPPEDEPPDSPPTAPPFRTNETPPDSAPAPTPPAAVGSAAIEDQTFCAIDVETTGFSPRLGDRVIEIAAVRTTADGTTIDRWSTLVDPARDIGATHVHGITAGDVIGAPTFGDVAGDLLHRMDGAVLVAHNKRFDLEFLASEFSRAGHQLDPWPSLCTLGLGAQLQPGAPTRRLAACCAHFGIPLPDAHSALCDAEAAARLLTAYLQLGRQYGITTLEQLGCTPLEFPRALQITPTGRMHPRGGGEQRLNRQASYLAGLVAKLDELGDGTADTAAYLDVLDRALEDRRLTDAEAQALAQTASDWGLDRHTIERAHHQYYGALLTAAHADGVITPLEQNDLDTVARLLNIDPTRPADMSAIPAAGGSADLRGQTVCFTGALIGTIGGAPITRPQAQELARQAGLEIKANVSKGLDLLVVADPDSQSGKAKRARELGTRVMGEIVFWRAINAPVD